MIRKQFDIISRSLTALPRACVNVQLNGRWMS